MGKFALNVIVTGTPRTGTSLVAGLVNLMGFKLGPEKWVKPPDRFNPSGYFECKKLMEVSNLILNKLGGNFHDLPDIKEGWTSDFEKEKRKISKIIRKGKIEMYKGNRLTLISDIYDELFPEAKWLYVSRDIEETYRSRFGEHISFEEWEELTRNRIDHWKRSKVSKKALDLNYRDFQESFDDTLARMVEHLGIELSTDQINDCKLFYKPGKTVRNIQR